MNCFIWGFNGVTSRIIKNLATEKVIIPKVWFFNKKAAQSLDGYPIHSYDMVEFLRIDTYCETYHKEIAECCVGIKHNDDVYQKVLKNIWNYIDCESRGEGCNHLKSYDWYLNKFHILYRFIYALFVREKIELCLFSNLNHEGLDVIIYNIAKAMGVKTLFLNNSPIRNHYDKIFYMTDNSDYGDFTYMKRKFEESDCKIERVQSYDVFFTKKYVKKKKTLKDFKLALPFYKPGKYGRLREYKKTLNSLCEKVDYSKKYVYFAMHLQPELTTSCLGGINCDQLLALERLSELIPDDWVIYAKENPGQTEKMRDSAFFQRLQSIKKVKLTPLSENSFELIAKSQFVSTITGTVGFESISAGKKVLIFGNTWYQKFNGVVKYRDDLLLSEVLNGEINHEQLERDFNNLLSKMPYGVIDIAYAKAIPTYDEEKSIASITSVVRECIKEMRNIK